MLTYPTKFWHLSIQLNHFENYITSNDKSSFS